MRLERIVIERLRRVLGLDDGVRLGEPALVVAALVPPRLLKHGAARDRLVGVEQRLEHLPLHLDQLERGPRLRERLGGNTAHGGAFEVRVLVHSPDFARADDCKHAGCGCSRRQVDPGHARPRMRAAQERALEHPGELDVAGVAGLAARLLVAVEPRRVPADDRARAGGPLDEHVLLDERPDLLVAALDLLLGLDQPRHVEIASSIRG